MDKTDISKKVGIVGWWFASNYGSVITYYSLYREVEKLGYYPVLVDCPIEKNIDGDKKTFAREFIESQLNVSNHYEWEKIKNVNEECSSFLVGSDQVWTPGSIKTMRGYFFFLDFINDIKKKIAYGISFGQSKFTGSGEVLDKARYYVKKFDYVSVREDIGVDACKESFDIDVIQVPDPVFFMGKRDYNSIAARSSVKPEKPYLLSYILDPTDDKRCMIQNVSKKIALPAINILDGRIGTFDDNSQKLAMPGIKSDVKEEDWIKYIKEAEYILTDSHHGAALAIIYNKPFICYANPSRGLARFTSLFKMLALTDRMIFSSEEIEKRNLLTTDIDYESVNKIIKKEKNRGKKWLENALKREKKQGSISDELYKKPQVQTISGENSVFKDDPDFKRCKIVVSLLKDYGIKHIVLSSGTRNMNLIRLFEGNDYFTTYNVLDERSAVFYAIGISLKLNECVAVCCTSGTAASNYLTGLTEAFYQKVPIVAITADRYPCLLGQMEDQTIPQQGMYGSVCKKSVSLPVNTDFLSDWETRRLISTALTEIRRNGDGPVHINVPVNIINKKIPSPEDLILFNNLRNIKRIDTSSDATMWDKYVNKLGRFNKILIVYGQSKVLSEDDKKHLSEFINKYNCVLIRDHLSNIHNIGILSFPILKVMSQQEFNEKLSPDLIITFGGMRMLNDPITYRLRWCKEPVEHWHIAEDGEIADKFRKMTTVFHCSMRQFLKNMLNKKIDKNKDNYYIDCWTKAADLYKEQRLTDYSQKYTIQEFMLKIPDASLLHIGIGNTIMYSNLYEINNDVEVFCNMGTNGIDGSASTFMGHVAVTDKLSFLLIGDLSFFYDMNSVFNKDLKGNVRIFMSNNDGAGLLRDINSEAITHEHHKVAKAYVESLGFKYIYATSKEMFDKNLEIFIDNSITQPIFFEVFT